MENDEEGSLEFEQLAPEKQPEVPSVPFRLITKVPGQMGVFSQDDLVFHIFQVDGEPRIRFSVRCADGRDPTDADMAAVQESMVFIAATPANSIPI
jgi:hypothetical protein